MRNQSLFSAITKVIGGEANTLLAIKVSFLSSSDASFSYAPLVIESLSIGQKFNIQYADDITVGFNIASADYAQLFANSQNLMAILTIRFANSQGQVSLTATPVQKTYRAIIIDPRDISKEVTDAALRTELDTSIKIRLIEDAVYQARQQTLNMIYQTTTQSEAIRSIANAFGMTSLSLVTPDNVERYDHIIIPPTRDFSNIFSWLQYKYGVYMCGINHYFTGGMLYVYAPFDTAPNTTNSITILQAEQGMGSGSQTYSSISGNVITIVTDSVLHSHDNSVSAAENRGTAVSFLRSSELIDGIVAVTDQSGAQFVSDPALTISLNNSRLAQSDTSRTRHAKMTDNPFSLASHLVEKQSLTTRVEWKMAIPFYLSPGEKVMYNSDENGTIRQRSGILENVVYEIGRVPRTSGTDLFACIATLTLRLDPVGTTTSTV